MSRPRPSAAVRAAVGRYGLPAVADWCERLAVGAARPGEPGDPDVAVVGGTTGWPEHWARSWGVRAFRALPVPPSARTLRSALADDAWRVREHALRVVVHHGLAEHLDAAAGLLTDPVPRVRTAAALVLARFGEVEHLAAVRTADVDQDRLAPALAAAERRLDRPPAP